jgi:hypothetical protein
MSSRSFKTVFKQPVYIYIYKASENIRKTKHLYSQLYLLYYPHFTNTTNTAANKSVSFFLLIASATGCTKQGLRF